MLRDTGPAPSKQELLLVLKGNAQVCLSTEDRIIWQLAQHPTCVSTALCATLCARSHGGHSEDGVPAFRNCSEAEREGMCA